MKQMVSDNHMSPLLFPLVSKPDGLHDLVRSKEQSFKTSSELGAEGCYDKQLFFIDWPSTRVQEVSSAYSSVATNFRTTCSALLSTCLLAHLPSYDSATTLGPLLM